MYAKYVNERGLLFPPYEKDGIVNYNSDSNAEQLIKEGYMLFIDSTDYTGLKNPRKRYKIIDDHIEAYWIEGEEPDDI